MPPAGCGRWRPSLFITTSMTTRISSAFAGAHASSRPAHQCERWAARGVDDLTVGVDGRVFASDAGSGAVYTIAPRGTTLDVFVPPGTIQGPNGLTTTPDGRWLYVSDYAGFVFRADTTKKTVI